jgi:quinolinate synthase
VLPTVVPSRDSAAEVARKSALIRQLARERNAVILAHNYQRGEVQDVADLVGDSLGLSRAAAAMDNDVIVFCGVHFMAETAAILAPDKIVLLPTTEGGCSLASSITADELRRTKAEYPGAVVVAYVNTSAEVKAESDYCCTSANAAQVVASIPRERDILFVPDMFLAAVVARQTGRDNIYAYPGYCHVHRMIEPEQVLALLADRPELDLLLHPECGCASSCMDRALEGTLPADRMHFMSTEGMVRHIRESARDTFAIGTEVGILHRLRKSCPGNEFVAVNNEAVCAFMKTVTLDTIISSLRTMEPRISVDPPLAQAARRAVDRMLAVT